jgi:hypothetical protein
MGRSWDQGVVAYAKLYHGTAEALSENVKLIKVSRLSIKGT